MTIDGMTVMVPVHTAPAFASPYVVEKPDALGQSTISRDGITLGSVSFPTRPRFYDRITADGVPYWKIATLHSRDVLATTVLQTLHPLPKPDQDLSILRHRAIARGRPDDRTQDARAARRGRQGRRRT